MGGCAEGGLLGERVFDGTDVRVEGGGQKDGFGRQSNVWAEIAGQAGE